MKYFKNLKKRLELKYWSPGDIVILENLNFPILYRASLSNNGGEPIATVLSFSKKEACVKLLNGEQWYVDLVNLINITAQARKRKIRVDNYMDENFDTSNNNDNDQQENTLSITLDLCKLQDNELEGMMNVFANLDNFEIAETIKKILTLRDQQVIENNQNN